MPRTTQWGLAGRQVTPGLPSFTMPSGRPAGAQGAPVPEEEPEERAESFSREQQSWAQPQASSGSVC